MAGILLFSVFVVATCGLVYELIAGALASYLLGDTVLQFSRVIGIYLFSMGTGSYSSRWIRKSLASNFVRIELLIGLFGGLSAALLFILFEWPESFSALLYLVVSIIGALVGLEIPIVLRLIEKEFHFKDAVSRVLAADYLGALIASFVFPLVMVPCLGLVRSSLLSGMLNTVVALWSAYFLKIPADHFRRLRAAGVAIFVGLLLAFIYSEPVMKALAPLSFN